MPTYYDIHCHIFNKNVVDRNLAAIIESVTKIIALKGNDLKKEELRERILSLNKILKDLLKPESADVYNVLDEAYDHEFVVTPLMFDLTFADDNHGTNGQNKRYKRQIKRTLNFVNSLSQAFKLLTKDPETKALLIELRRLLNDYIKSLKKKDGDNPELFDDNNYVQQIIELQDLAKKNNRVKPFFGVDPRREYDSSTQENVLEKVKSKLLGANPLFKGVKLYAPSGFSPLDPVLIGSRERQGIYGFCQENHIPITVHCSNAGFACFSNKLLIKGPVNFQNQLVLFPQPFDFKYNFFSLKAGEAIHERATLLNHPRLWAEVLNQFPNLTLNLAHFGGSGQLMEFVHYQIPEDLHRIDADDFEDQLLPKLMPEDVDFVERCYKKVKRKRVLNSLVFEERRDLWQKFYNAKLIDNWSKAIFDIIRDSRYPNAYTDLSCFTEGNTVQVNGEHIYRIQEHLSEFKSSFFDKMTDYQKSKILYGSDFFLVEFQGVKMRQYITDFRAVFGSDFDLIANKNSEQFLKINGQPGRLI